MTHMKKHPFLQVDYQSTVKLTASEKRQLARWLAIAGEVVEYLFKKKIVPTRGVKSIQVSLLICGDARIRELNREYRSKDYVTDVLSFPAEENLRSTATCSASLFLGDLAICHGQTRRQARKFKISYMDEFIHLFFHGIIHLLGYDHELSPEEEKLMQEWEETALKKFSGIKKGS